MVYPLGVIVALAYDHADRPATLDLRVGENPLQPVVTASTYEPFGPLASLSFANGLR